MTIPTLTPKDPVFRPWRPWHKGGLIKKLLYMGRPLVEKPLKVSYMSRMGKLPVVNAGVSQNSTGGANRRFWSMFPLTSTSHFGIPGFLSRRPNFFQTLAPPGHSTSRRASPRAGCRAPRPWCGASSGAPGGSPELRAPRAPRSEVGSRGRARGAVVRGNCSWGLEKAEKKKKKERRSG